MIASEAFWIHLVTHVVEIVGTAIIVIGAFGSLGAFAIDLIRRSAPSAELVADFRSRLGRSILLGLEFLVPPTSSTPSRSSRPSKACLFWQASCSSGPS